MKIEPRENELNGQIVLFDIIEEQEEQAEFKIVAYPKRNNLILSYKQIVTILEALYNFKTNIEKLEVNNLQEKIFLDKKVQEIDTLFEYLEKGINYNFKNAVNKSINKHKSDVGIETFEWLRGENI
ncbi:hypothetical protein CLTEP_02410 [Clostridium tepidiprofundi DSM 19306]|uniref:Uncharacterized protein n=1 Tax=Clostridium tepidiprofundi DSM 19306 TaxID=1121338 RepID=A0A151B7E1_9CLOT|nr:hypothetical protein [Clostridium tepidiprofundi]KYH35848.1 hypothetical protein CLTEP_02410 [Clostridium tepidiprofundi DSM 19306]